jgi:hypothetical protein
LKGLIEMKAAVGTELWDKKMETVRSLEKDADKFSLRAYQLRKKAERLELEQREGKGKRVREV